MLPKSGGKWGTAVSKWERSVSSLGVQIPSAYLATYIGYSVMLIKEKKMRNSPLCHDSLKYILLYYHSLKNIQICLFRKRIKF